MTDRDALLYGILTNRADDTARLVYADYLQENGEPERAEFIRVQIELARLGPKHKAFGEPDGIVVHNPHGMSDYFTFECYPDEGLSVGDRIDLYCYRTDRNNRVQKPRVQYGLRVVKFVETGDALGTQEAVVCADAESKSWAGAALAARESALLRERYVSWWPLHYDGRDSMFGGFTADTVIETSKFQFQFARGFIVSVTCSAADWLRHADVLYWHPEQTVECPRVKWKMVQGLVNPETRQRHDGQGVCPRWCEHCSGAGRIPRPFVPTAQPLERVRLTTHPEGEVTRAGAVRNWKCPPRLGDHVLDAWRAEWPDLEFFLPNVT